MNEGCGGTRQQKHIGFNGQLCKLEDLVDTIGGLATRVRGDVGKQAPQPQLAKLDTMIGLAEFLETGSNRINELIARLGKYRAELEELLF